MDMGNSELSKFPELSAAKKAVGFNQTKKAVNSGKAKKVYAAKDADGLFLLQIKRLCESKSVPLDESATMSELGTVCGIEVDCAVCAIIE